MDRSTFDGIARLLAGATSRRAGLQAALGAALGLAAGAVEPTGAARRDDRGRDRDRPKPEGPCGDGSRKENACTRDKQCCTGYCEKSLKNRDGRGRCRCIRRGRACKPSQTCCGSLTCVDGVCGKGGSGPVPTGDPCTSGDTCAAAAATCTEYASGTPAGTYCLLSAGEACSAGPMCESGACVTGVCAVPIGAACVSGQPCADSAASCASYAFGPSSPSGTFCLVALSGACTEDIDCVGGLCVSGACVACTVCAGGMCDYTSIYDASTAATTGAVIGIAPGDYDDFAEFRVSADVRRCGPSGTVKMTANSSTPNYNSTCALCLDGAGIEVTVSDMVISGADGDQVVRLDNGSLTLTRCTVTMPSGGQVYTNPISVYQDTSLTLDSSLIDANVSPGDGAIAVDPDGTLTAVDTVFSNNQSDGDGGAIYTDRGTVTLTRCSFTGNSATDGGALFIRKAPTAVGVTDCTFTSNDASGYGGAIAAEAGSDTSLLTLAGTTSITGNTAAVDGGGISASRASGGIITITGATGIVSGNTGGDQCILSTDDGGSYSPVANCAY